MRVIAHSNQGIPQSNHVTRHIHFVDGLCQLAVFNKETLYTIRKVTGTAYGKVRAMVNDRGEKVKKALPSTPVEVLGLNDVPLAGDILDSTDEKIARSVAEKRVAKKRIEEIQQNSKVSLDDLFQRIQEGEIKDLNIVVKADVQGTIEALRSSLQNT